METEELAEFLGIMFGDGYMNCYKNHHYFIEIAGYKINDYVYHKDYIHNLMIKLFGIKPNFRLRKNQNTLYTSTGYKKIFNLLKKYGMIIGKKENLSIPNWIKQNKEFSKVFIKGYFDTDGSIIIRKRNQNSISFGSKDKGLILQIKRLLEDMNYFVCYNSETREDIRGFITTKYVARINRKAHIQKFIREICSSNPHKIEKFRKIKNGDTGI